MHSVHFEDWCQRNGVDTGRSRAGLSSVDRLDFGPDTERVVIDYFFGGSERVAQLTAFFEWLKAQGVQLCILTSGETAAVRQLFEAGIAPWAGLFAAGGWIANTYDEFFVTEEDGRVGKTGQAMHYALHHHTIPVHCSNTSPAFVGTCTISWSSWF